MNARGHMLLAVSLIRLEIHVVVVCVLFGVLPIIISSLTLFVQSLVYLSGKLPRSPFPPRKSAATVPCRLKVKIFSGLSYVCGLLTEVVNSMSLSL